jgi:hypothetical protein
VPKFNIYPRAGVNVQTGKECVADRRISVGHSKGATGYAQLGVGLMVSANPHIAAAAGAASVVNEDPEWHTEWVTFSDRSMINQLIRELRAARDAAFGKDE